MGHAGEDDPHAHQRMDWDHRSAWTYAVSPKPVPTSNSTRMKAVGETAGLGELAA